MSEIVKTLDLSTMTNADGSNFFVVFCSRQSDGSVITKPGHAFVVWGKEDASAAMSSQIAFGFYPDPGNVTKELLGLNVPGELIDEATKPASNSGTLLTGRLIVKVDKTPFDSTQSEITNWSTSDYNLYSKNCISFAAAVANDLGMSVPDSSLFQLPADFLLQLIQQNGAAAG